MSVFSYASTKDGTVLISWRRRPATTLRGRRARRFLLDAERLDEDGLQLLMARVTGNFKRGNER
ncbi:MAG: hypothetical protein H0U03_09325 [Actinobacteria bacterium]|nr:hypothetical protein [Actinomycetota bacterium]